MSAPTTTVRWALAAGQHRGPILEARHVFSAVAVNAEGEVLAVAGEPGRFTAFRSAAKPFQMLPLIERGHADRWGFSEADLALMAASHTGSPAHVAGVQGMLDRIGLAASNLACGYHDPVDPESVAWLQEHPGARTALYNNCSGKHAGMLAMALSEGWSVEGYHLSDHPLQRAIRQVVADLCSMRSEDILIGLDGCSVPVFGVPLTAMARGYARLATARSDGDARERALHRIARAMNRHPLMVEGSGRFTSALMEVSGPRLIAKVGAEGLELVGDLERNWGIAVKCEDGAMRSLAPATIEFLAALGVLDARELRQLTDYRRIVVRNVAGLDAGWIEASCVAVHGN